MTDQPERPPDSPHELLITQRNLIRRVRAVQRFSWFPLLLLGALSLAAYPFARVSPHHTTCQTIHAAEGPVCATAAHWLPTYWELGLVLVYCATAWFYIRRSRSRGVGTPVRPYILTGIGITALLTGAHLFRVYYLDGVQIDLFGMHLDPASTAGHVVPQIIGAATAIGLALLVLAWVERNPALLLVTLAYLTIHFKQMSLGLPQQFTPGAWLLLAGLGFALIRPAHRVSTS